MTPDFIKRKLLARKTERPPEKVQVPQSRAMTEQEWELRDPYGWERAEMAEIGIFPEYMSQKVETSQQRAEVIEKQEPIKANVTDKGRKFIEEIKRIKELCKKDSYSGCLKLSGSAASAEGHSRPPFGTQSTASPKSASLPTTTSASADAGTASGSAGVSPRSGSERFLRHKARCSNCGRTDCTGRGDGTADNTCTQWYADANHRDVKWNDYEQIEE